MRITWLSKGNYCLTCSIYSTVELAKLTGFSIKQLDYWAIQGILVPSVRRSDGPGTRKIYSIDDLVQLQFIRRLKNHGWSTRKIGQAIKILREIMQDPNPLKHAILIHGKSTLIALCKTREGERIAIDALSTGGQQVMGIVLEMLMEEAQQIANSMNNPVMDKEMVQ